MAIGIITGSGTYALPGFEGGEPEPVATPWGEALVARGRLAGVEVAHVSRHGAGHVRLSNHVAHRANLAALRALGVDGVLAVTVCGAVDPSVELGSLICFDDLHFLANRLADGSICTFYDAPGDPRRGHWIYEDPYSPELRPALQHPGRDPRAGRVRRHRGLPDGRARDGARRGGGAAVRPRGVCDGLCQRRPGRRDARRAAARAHRREHGDVRAAARGGAAAHRRRRARAGRRGVPVPRRVSAAAALVVSGPPAPALVAAVGEERAAADARLLRGRGAPAGA